MKLKLCAVIEFYVKEEKNRVNNETTIYKWYNRFENGCEPQLKVISETVDQKKLPKKKWMLCGIFWRNQGE